MQGIHAADPSARDTMLAYIALSSVTNEVMQNSEYMKNKIFSWCLMRYNLFAKCLGDVGLLYLPYYVSNGEFHAFPLIGGN
jgi:hypothetical protein